MAKEEKKCFVIMPISDVHGYEPGHFGRVYEYILKPAIVKAGYHPVRADDASKTDYIVLGVIKNIVNFDLVLCDFSARNPNVMYELGLRHAFNKPAVLIKDKVTEKVFDIQGLRYTEYDHSLRVDGVQKDIDKISKAIEDTVSASPQDVNSIIQLAGIKPAEVPENQVVSPETHLILNALSSMESMISANKKNSNLMFFKVEGEKVIFLDGTDAVLGDPIFAATGAHLGVLVDIHPNDEKIFIKEDAGKVVPFSASSVKSRGLTTIPF